MSLPAFTPARQDPSSLTSLPLRPNPVFSASVGNATVLLTAQSHPLGIIADSNLSIPFYPILAVRSSQQFFLLQQPPFFPTAPWPMLWPCLNVTIAPCCPPASLLPTSHPFSPCWPSSLLSAPTIPPASQIPDPASSCSSIVPLASDPAGCPISALISLGLKHVLECFAELGPSSSPPRLHEAAPACLPDLISSFAPPPHSIFLPTSPCLIVPSVAFSSWARA